MAVGLPGLMLRKEIKGDNELYLYFNDKSTSKP